MPALDEIKLVATDLDGTLTQHKSRLVDPCRRTLEALSRRYRLLIVGAGGCERIYRQTEGCPADIAGYYGMQYSTVRDGAFVMLEDHRAPTDRAGVISRIEGLRSELGFTAYAGQTAEFHDCGIITFPILGTAAPIEQKLAFDPDRKIRRGCYDRVKGVFRDYTVFIGGSSSFDIVPFPYDKLYAINVYMRIHGVGREQAVYFGDDYGAGGNDEPIYKSDIRFICVDHYTEFPKIAGMLL
jgi:HAD superfamily hydrolase (TIGR01484 family)